MRRASILGGAFSVAAWLVACNGLTGIGDIGVGDETTTPDAETVDAPATVGEDSSPSTREDARTPGPGDAGPSDAGKGDADAKTTVLDARPPDVVTPPTCTNQTPIGPRYGTTAEGQGWSQDEGILAPDNSWAHTNGDHGNPLLVSGFTFGVPANATVKGIKVEIGRNSEGLTTDTAIALNKGTSKSNGEWTRGSQGPPFTISAYGGPTDLWGASWNASDLAALSVSVKVGGNGDGHADSLGVTIYYCTTN